MRSPFLFDFIVRNFAWKPVAKNIDSMWILESMNLKLAWHQKMDLLNVSYLKISKNYKNFSISRCNTSKLKFKRILSRSLPPWTATRAKVADVERTNEYISSNKSRGWPKLLSKTDSWWVFSPLVSKVRSLISFWKSLISLTECLISPFIGLISSL